MASKRFKKQFTTATFLLAVVIHTVLSCSRSQPSQPESVPNDSPLRISQQDLDNMLNTLRGETIDRVQGDTTTSECTRNQLSKRERKENHGFQLDFWSYVICTLSVMYDTTYGGYLQLNSPTQSDVTMVTGTSLQTMYLPLYAHNTASFTTVPRTNNPTFFITATLSGCDVFVASAGSTIRCPLVLIHTNHCGAMATDVNQLEAEAVLTLNDVFGCSQQYRVQYRFAVESHRQVIEAGHYNYFTKYYPTPSTSVVGTAFYGYTEGGEWYFCYANRQTTGTCDFEHPI